MTQVITQKINPQIINDGFVLNNRYEVLSLVNRGGQSEIYKVRDTKIGEFRAIKLIHCKTKDDLKSAKGLKKEYEILQTLKGSSHFPTAYSVNVETPYVYMVLEWIEGLNFSDYIKQNAPIPFDTWRWIAKKIASALLECHTARLIHNDIKPGNIILTPSDEIRMIDFGISEKAGSYSAETEADKGTKRYAAPEKLFRQELSTGSDLYSLGITLYELLTGRYPFKHSGSDSVTTEFHDNDYIRVSDNSPDIPLWVDSFFLKLLQHYPEKRLQGVREVLSLLSIEASIDKSGGVDLLSSCASCGEVLWNRLSFCSYCGSDYRLTAESGSYGVIVEKVNDTDVFLNHVINKTSFSPSAYRRYLFHKSYPRLFVRGLSQQTAEYTAEMLSNENNHATMVKFPVLKSLKRMRLAGFHLFSASVAIYFLLSGTSEVIGGLNAGGSESFKLNISLIAGILLCIFIFIDMLTPLLPGSFLNPVDDKNPWGVINGMKGIIKGITEPELRGRASSLLRRVVLLHDDIIKIPFTEQGAKDIDNSISRIALMALKNLARANMLLGSLTNSGGTHNEIKIKNLQGDLSVASDPELINRLTETLADLMERQRHALELTKEIATIKFDFSEILSEINSLHLLLSNDTISQCSDKLKSLSSRFKPTQKRGLHDAY